MQVLARTPSVASPPALRVRWLGRVRYAEALDLQTALFDRRVAGEGDDYLLLLEHPHVYTLGRRAKREHLLLTADGYAARGAEIVEANRGGDVTYHGPGQLVGYPILRLGPSADVVRHVRNLEEILIRTLADFGVTAYRVEGLTGVWTLLGGTDAKIAAIGCRVTRGVTMHGFALNVAPDLSYFRDIVPCGLAGRPVTSMRRLLGEAAPRMREVVGAVTSHSAAVFGREPSCAAEAASAGAGVPLRFRAVETGPDVRSQARSRPLWLRNKAAFADPGYRELKGMMRSLDLHTVCEEAQCPNIYECWSERTATLMLLGDVCTRSCSFCDVATGKPPAYDTGEPDRVAEALGRMNLEHAVLTSVARDDLPDGGAAIFAGSIEAIRRRRPGCTVEVLVPDFKGDAAAARVVFDARPDVFNHNIETIARLQRLTRPQASYARSLTLLARAAAAGLVAKSGIICGMGETEAEILVAMNDLSAVGVRILTLGQYLRPSQRHLPVDRWVHPEEFARLRAAGAAMGFAHVEAGPLVRSSYHARASAEAGCR